MNFIRLTDFNQDDSDSNPNRLIMVNADHIRYMTPNRIGTTINLMGDRRLQVLESPESIVKLARLQK